MNQMMNPGTNQMMNQITNPLDGLRDIHLPDPVPFWPLAPGWWVVAGAVVVAVIAAISIRRLRRAGVRFFALREVDQVRQAFQETDDSAAFALGVSSIVRRVALVLFDREQVAALHGSRWLEFLQSTGRQDGFDAEMAQNMEAAIYGAPGLPGTELTEETGDRLAVAAKNWIRRNT